VPTWKVRAAPAAANPESPGWVAVMVQAPAPTAVAEPTVVAGPAVLSPAAMVAPETVHTAGVADRNEMARLDVGACDVTGTWASRVTVALRVMCAPTMISGRPGWVPSGCANLTVCWPVPVPIWKACATSGAAANSALPACDAVIVHTPAVNAVTIVAETVHTSGVAERNETCSPDDAEARTVISAPTAVSGAPGDVPAGWPKLIVCRAAPVAVSQACPTRAGRSGTGGSRPVRVAEPIIAATRQMPRSPHAPRQGRA
jgi:hypothetical protein